MAELRRKFSPEFKAQVVLKVLRGVKPGAEAYRECGIGSQLLSRWRARLLENATRMFGDGSPSYSEHKARMAELERLARRLALEIEI